MLPMWIKSPPLSSCIQHGQPIGGTITTTAAPSKQASSSGPTISLSSDDSLTGTPPLLHNVPLPVNPAPSTLPNGPLLHCGAGTVVVTCNNSGESSSASTSVIPPHEAVRLQLPQSPTHSSSAGSTTICEADVHQQQEEDEKKALPTSSFSSCALSSRPSVSSYSLPGKSLDAKGKKAVVATSGGDGGSHHTSRQQKRPPGDMRLSRTVDDILGQSSAAGSNADLEQGKENGEKGVVRRQEVVETSFTEGKALAQVQVQSGGEPQVKKETSARIRNAPGKKKSASLRKATTGGRAAATHGRKASMPCGGEVIRREAEAEEDGGSSSSAATPRKAVRKKSSSSKRERRSSSNSRGVGIGIGIGAGKDDGADEITCLPEKEEYQVELAKDDKGLGITVAGYVCEKGEEDTVPTGLSVETDNNTKNVIYYNALLYGFFSYFSEDLCGIFVKNVIPGSSADKSRRIVPNDQIVEVRQGPHSASLDAFPILSLTSRSLFFSFRWTVSHYVAGATKRQWRCSGGRATWSGCPLCATSEGSSSRSCGRASPRPTSLPRPRRWTRST